MSLPPLPDALRQFIRENIPTMEHVDVLVQLMRAAPRALDPAEVATLATLSAARVASCLEDLVTAGLSALQDTGRYAYAARTAQQRQGAELLLIAYGARPVALVREVYDRPDA